MQRVLESADLVGIVIHLLGAAGVNSLEALSVHAVCQRLEKTLKSAALGGRYHGIGSITVGLGAVPLQTLPSPACMSYYLRVTGKGIIGVVHPTREEVRMACALAFEANHIDLWHGRVPRSAPANALLEPGATSQDASFWAKVGYAAGVQGCGARHPRLPAFVTWTDARGLSRLETTGFDSARIVQFLGSLSLEELESAEFHHSAHAPYSRHLSRGEEGARRMRDFRPLWDEAARAVGHLAGTSHHLVRCGGLPFASESTLGYRAPVSAANAPAAMSLLHRDREHHTGQYDGLLANAVTQISAAPGPARPAAPTAPEGGFLVGGTPSAGAVTCIVGSGTVELYASVLYHGSNCGVVGCWSASHYMSRDCQRGAEVLEKLQITVEQIDNIDNRDSSLTERGVWFGSKADKKRRDLAHHMRVT